MIWAVRGNLLGQYLKPGYNVVVRYQRGDTPDDKLDCFMVLGSSNTKSSAKKLAKNTGLNAEVVEFQTKKPQSS
jgi:hypothetical protein